MTKPIGMTALRRAALYLKGQDNGCNEVKTLRTLIEQAQDDINDGQAALMPVERSHNVRARQIHAFNACKQAGGDLDDALGSAYRAAMRHSPAPGCSRQEPGLYAIRHYSSWADGDVCESLATYDEKGDGVWRHHENGAPVLEFVGDKILQAWPLTDTPAPALTYEAGLKAAADKVRDQIVEHTEEHGTWTDEGKVLSAGYKAYAYQLHRIAESIDELANSNPVPASHVISLGEVT
jgi:hypothetical protein